MNIQIADEAGFCFGVKRALTLIDQLLDQKQGVQIFGELIHNKSVLKELKKKGVDCVERIEAMDPNKKTVIRTHGIPLNEENILKEKNIDYIDATCPLVKKTHQIIQKLNENDTQIIIVGDKNHPEIKATRSYSRNGIVINSIEEAKNTKPQKKVRVIAQTTLDSDFFKEIINKLVDKAENFEVFDTICQATKVRQEAIKRLASKVDFVIVIGSKHSSNTKKLYDISFKKNKNTYYIENSEELKHSRFSKLIKKYKTVGITAGASTPPEEIKKVKTFFQNIKESKNGKTG